MHHAELAIGMEAARENLLKVARERPRFTPRTGKTQKANKARVIRRGRRKIIVRATNNLAHAAAIDKGARPHIIRPRNGPRLVFWSAKWNKMVYARQVHHPGNKPYRFLYGATTAAGRKFRSDFPASMRKIAARF